MFWRTMVTFFQPLWNAGQQDATDPAAIEGTDGELPETDAEDLQSNEQVAREALEEVIQDTDQSASSAAIFAGRSLSPAAPAVPRLTDLSSSDPLESYGSPSGLEQRQTRALRFLYNVLKAGEPAHRALGDSLWLTAERALTGRSPLEVQDALFAMLLQDLRDRGHPEINAVEIGPGGHSSIMRTLLKQGASVAAVEKHAFDSLKNNSLFPEERRRLSLFRDLKFLLNCILHGPRYNLAVLNMPGNQRQLQLARMAVLTGGILVLNTEMEMDFIAMMDNDADWEKILHYPENAQHGRMTLDSGTEHYANQANFCVYRRTAEKRTSLGAAGKGLRNAYDGGVILRLNYSYALLINFDKCIVDVARYSDEGGCMTMTRIGSIDTLSGKTSLHEGESAEDFTRSLSAWLKRN